METKRLLLRHWRETDAETLYALASDPDIGSRAGWAPHQTIEESRNVIQTIFNDDTTWAIVLKETDEAIGAMGYFTKDTRGDWGHRLWRVLRL